MLFEVEAALDLEPGDRGLRRRPDDRPRRAGILPVQHGRHRCRNGGRPLYAAGSAVGAVACRRRAAYYVIRQEHISADALAVHSLPLAPQHLAGNRDRGRDAGAARPGRRALSSFPARHRGGRLVAAEHKLITAGGFYDRVGDYAALMREAVGCERRCSGRPATSASPTITARRSTRSPNASRSCRGLRAAPRPTCSRPERTARRLRLDPVILLRVLRLHDMKSARTRSSRASSPLPCSGSATMLPGDRRRRVPAPAERLCEVLLDFEMRFEDKAGDRGFGLSDAARQPRHGLFRLPERCAAGADPGGVGSCDDPASRPPSSAGSRPTALGTCAVDLPGTGAGSTPSAWTAGAAATAGQHIPRSGISRPG